MTCKCKDCDKRTLGCHSTCEDYKAFKAENEKRRERANNHYEYWAYKTQQIIATKKRYKIGVMR